MNRNELWQAVYIKAVVKLGHAPPTDASSSDYDQLTRAWAAKVCKQAATLADMAVGVALSPNNLNASGVGNI